MTTRKPLPPDALVDYSKDGVPVSRKMEEEAHPENVGTPNAEDRNNDSSNSGVTGGTHNKKRQGTEDAQKRSDTGTGL
jgi:hypothetical protein